MKGFVAIVLFAVIASACSEEVDNEIVPNQSKGVPSIEERQRLISDLFSSYDKRNHPLNHTVKYGVAVIKFDVDEATGIVETESWLKIMWNDPRLKWDPSDYGGQGVIRMLSTELWKPDIRLYNAAHPSDGMQCSDTNVLIYPSGKVLWVPPCHLKSLCNTTLDRSPYESQSCMLKFGSWTYDGYSMDVQFFEGKADADLSDFWDITDWEITGHSAKREEKFYDCCTEPYVSLTYNFEFKRKSNRASCRS